MANRRETFLDLIRLIEEKSEPTRRDEEHATITHYVNMFLSKFGKEGCMLVGSTGERTRVRLNRNEADSDFILICGKAVIPTECLVYNQECPCFVSVKGKDLLQYFNVDLIDGEFLPADLLRKVRPEAFSLLRIIFKAMTKRFHTIGDQTPRDAIPRDSKVGAEMKEFKGADMYDRKKVVRGPKAGKTLNSRELNVAKFFKVICEILMNLKNPEVCKDLLKTNTLLLFQLLIPGQLDLVEGQDDIDQVTQNVEDELNLQEEIGEQPEVAVRYSSITSKDYVPSFRLSNPPRGFELWVYRDRVWPRNEVVEDIAKSEFFLVAKPALVNERPESDFCLSFTLAEQKLFDEVYKVPAQRRCYLAVKALHKADLKDQNILKTFHWKTVFFWISEKWPVWTDETLLGAVTDVLGRMIESLEKLELEHFFIKSNLFAHLKGEEMKPEVDNLISKIKAIRADVTSTLRRFLRLDEIDGYDVTTLPVAEANEAREAKRLKADKEGAQRFNEAFAGILEQVSSNTGSSPSASASSVASSQTSYDANKFVDAAFDIARQIGQDAKSNKTFLTKLEKPLFSVEEADLISRAAQVRPTDTGEGNTSDTQVKDLSKDLAEYLIPKERKMTMEDLDVD